MKELILSTGSSPTVSVRAGDRLHVKGWERLEVRARSQDEDLALQQTGDQVTVSSDERLELHVPFAANLVIESAQDEVSVKAVHGSLHAKHVSDSLILQETGPATVDFVGDDLHARQVAGPLSAGQIGGNANLRELNGELKAAFIGGHLNLDETAVNVSAEAGGNANLAVAAGPGQVVRVTAGGLIACRVPADLDARLDLNSGGSLTLRLGGSSKSIQDGHFEGVYGSGSAEFELDAGGAISVLESSPAAEGRPFGFEFDKDWQTGLGDAAAAFGDDFREQIAEQLEGIEEQIEAQMSSLSTMLESWELPPEKIERIQRRTAEKINQAQEKIRRAQERASRKIAQAQQRAEHQRQRMEHHRKHHPGSHMPDLDLKFNLRGREKSDPVSEQERLMILNMLAEKKISLAEAEALLSALEGGK